MRNSDQREGSTDTAPGPAKGVRLLAAWLLSVLLTMTACHPESQPISGAALPAVTVRVQSIEAKKHPVVEDVVGTVRAKTRATVEANVSGRIARMPVGIGQRVNAGELLAELDVQEIKAKLDQAMAVREQAAQELKRYEALVRQKAATQQEFDAVQTRFQVAEAAVKEAATMLGYARVTAPFAGVITRKLANVGDLASPGRALVELEDPTSLRLEADVPEALVDHVQAGAKMNLRIASLPADVEGTVSEVAPAADPSSRTFLVKLDLPPLPSLRAGSFGRVAVPVEERASLRVPVSAVVQRGQMEIVFIADGARAQMRLVKSGRRIGDEIELVAGAVAGELVVSEGADQLVDGQPLDVTP